MRELLTRVLDQPAWTIYLVTATVVFAEDAFFAGFLIPGETAALLGGVSAHQGHTALAWMLTTVCIHAVAGDSVGYEVGRVLGPRLLGHRRLRAHAGRVERAQEFLRKRGGVAVFAGRWTAFLRALMPTFAGSSRMPYARSLTWNAVGGITWGTTVVLIGYLAGASYERIARRLGEGTAIGVGLVVVVDLVVWHLRRGRREATETAHPTP